MKQFALLEYVKGLTIYMYMYEYIYKWMYMYKWMYWQECRTLMEGFK